jgi:hypothetical protein
MKRVFFFIVLACMLFWGNLEARAEISEQYVERDGVKLYEKPDAASKVVETAGKGWVLHAFEELTGTDNKKWYRIWEINSDGTGYWYVHLNWPNTDGLFVQASDVKQLEE